MPDAVLTPNAKLVTPNGHSAKGGLAIFAEQRSWKKWTAVNDKALRALADDPDAEENRLWALTCLRTWGNPNEPKDRAIDPASGKPMRLCVEFVRELRVSKQTLSRWASLLAAKNRLHALPSGVYPVDDPSKPFALAEKRVQSGSMGLDARKYKIYKEGWEKTHPDKARRQRELRVELKEINREQLKGFKLWLQSQTPATDGHSRSQTPPESVSNSPIYKDRARAKDQIYISEESSSSSALSTQVESGPDNATTTTSPPDKPKIAEALRSYGSVDGYAVEDLRRRCRAHAPDCTTAEIVHWIHDRAAHAKSKPIGFLLTAVPRCFQGDAFHQWRAEKPELLTEPKRKKAPTWAERELERELAKGAAHAG